MSRETGMARKVVRCVVIAGLAACAIALPAQQEGLAVSVDARGHYSIGSTADGSPVLASGVAAKIDNKWVRSDSYPHHVIESTSVDGYLGSAEQWKVEFSGLAGEPDLLYRLRSYKTEPFADLQVTVWNHNGKSVDVQSIRAVDAVGDGIAALGGPTATDRVLSDSFSEDRPAMQIHDLADAKQQMHRAVGSQLIYNLDSRQSLFLGALTSERFLTILRLHVGVADNASHITRYEVDSTGTTEMEKENAVEKSPPADQVELRLPVAPGGELVSETLAISSGEDYHRQLETYGFLIRKIQHARVSAPPLMGWWSWTAFYFGLNEGAALTNAQWEAEHLKRFGYDIFHIDEGYQYARGEYTTPDAHVFPNGLGSLEHKVRGLGLTLGIWTAPFEVSERSRIFRQHPDWLVKNAQRQPIHAGFVVDGKDALYILDVTNPAAQQYLRETYSNLVKEWGIRYIKMDFMDDSAIEGYYYKPHTTAMEAQRIGLDIIRKAVGEDVLLDKDGSAMLNPVGYVDYGRISQDTGHSFDASREAVTGIASRYYMNRNFFVADPDAFTVSTQRITDQSWHVGNAPLTLNEAKISIALAAVSGGMLEIGDDLPSLEHSPDRVALIENSDLIDMVRLGKASAPLDLMSYSSSDQLPSIFYLKESPRQSVVTIFNWTEKPRSKIIRLADLGLEATGQFAVTDVFDQSGLDSTSGSLSIDQPAHSVTVLKVLDRQVLTDAPALAAVCPQGGAAGENLAFSARTEDTHPGLVFHWDFGDGIHVDGAQLTHAWTEPGDYEVHVTAAGLNNSHSEKTCIVHLAGHLPTVFAPANNVRYQPH
jgi:alpha-galactosidase